MQSIVHHRSSLQFLNDSDEQALNLFDNLNHNLDDDQNQIQQQQSFHSHNESNQSIPIITKLKKMKHQSKRQIKENKIKQKKKEKRQKRQKKQNKISMSTPRKRLKRNNSEGSVDNDKENEMKDDPGSSEFESSQKMIEQLQRLNPEYNKSPTKRLKKSNKKSKIQNKQGFRIQQLGNDAQIQYKNDLSQNHDSNESQFSDSQKNKKKKLKRKQKKYLSNEELLNNLKQIGMVESQNQEINEQKAYDNGLDMLSSMKDKKKSIKVINKMFGDLDIDLDNQDAILAPPPENFQLELKPKQSTGSSNRNSFLSKAETIKKQRGLQANVDLAQYEKAAQQKAKRSMAKLVSNIMNQQLHEQIDLEIKVPNISRGRSAQIINNTVFLKSFISKTQSKDSEEPPIPSTILQSRSQPENMKYIKKSTSSRYQLFKQIKDQTRFHRSKYITQQQLKQSFKKTNLQQVEQVRKKIEEKRRKQALSGSQSDDQDQNFEEMVEDENELQRQIPDEQQILNGNLQQDNNQQKVNIQIQIQEIQAIQSPKQIQGGQQKQDIEIQNKDQIQKSQQQQKQQGQQRQYHQNIDQLAQVSDQQKLVEEESIINEGENISQEESMRKSIQQNSENEQIQEQNNQFMEQFDKEKLKQIKQLEDQGIFMKKVRKHHEQKDMSGEIISIENLNQNKIQNNQQKKFNAEQQIIANETEEFNQFKKLRRIAVVIAQKKKQRERGQRIARQYIQSEAEQGSDNEDHDDAVKRINYEEEQKQYEGMDLDQDLVELIDNAVDINEENQYQAFRKYIQDVKIRDREEIKKIIRGQFKRKHENLQLQIQQDQKNRMERMQEVRNWMKKRQQEDEKGIYAEQQNQSNQDSDEDSYEKQAKQVVLQQSESQEIPESQQLAKLQKFLEDTLPSTKRQLNTNFSLIDLGPLPESIKLQKTSSMKKMKLQKIQKQAKQQKISLVNGWMNIPKKSKQKSSLVNETLNKKSTTFKLHQNSLFSRIKK